MKHHERRGTRRAARSALAMLAVSGAMVLAPTVASATTVQAVAPKAPAAAAQQAASTTGWLRLAHLSPDTPNVDVYLTPFGGTKAVVLRSVGYGDVSAYRRVPEGTYTAAMWLSGKTKSGAPILSGNARITAAKAYTVAAVGRRADISARVLQDDLRPPDSGQGKVRLIQASTQASVVTVSAVDGPVIARRTSFGASSDYATVPAGRWQVKVEPQGGSAKALTTTVDVSAGSVNSLFLLDADAGTLSLESNVDSKGAGAVPTGGVDTGYGPPADNGPGSVTIAAAIGGAALLLAALSGMLRRVRRSSSPATA